LQQVCSMVLLVLLLHGAFEGRHHGGRGNREQNPATCRGCTACTYTCNWSPACNSTITMLLVKLLLLLLLLLLILLRVLHRVLWLVHPEVFLSGIVVLMVVMMLEWLVMVQCAWGCVLSIMSSRGVKSLLLLLLLGLPVRRGWPLSAERRVMRLGMVVMREGLQRGLLWVVRVW